MPDFEDSLMMQTEKESMDFFTEKVALFEPKKKEKGPDEGPEELEMKEINEIPERKNVLDSNTAPVKDSISDLEEKKITPQNAYFDPLGLKMIYDEAMLQLLRNDEEEETDEEKQAKTIREDYVKRVDRDILAYRKDEKEEQIAGYNGEAEVAKMAKSMGPEEAAKQYNAGRAFTPDKYEEVIPDTFQVGLEVKKVAGQHQADWKSIRESQNGVGARLKYFFGARFGVTKPSETELLRSFTKSLPEIQQLIAQGELAAKEKNPNAVYNPDEDDGVMTYLLALEDMLQKDNLGESVVHMVTKKDGKEAQSYSFKFSPFASSVKSTSVLGVVTNPPVVTPAESKAESVSRMYDVDYAGFLKGTSKIRGIIGARRTYSLIGYNSASFAKDVATAAGLSFEEEDTTSVVNTIKEKTVSVDSPFRIATMIQREQQAELEEAKRKEEEEKAKKKAEEEAAKKKKEEEEKEKKDKKPEKEPDKEEPKKEEKIDYTKVDEEAVRRNFYEKGSVEAEASIVINDNEAALFNVEPIRIMLKRYLTSEGGLHAKLLELIRPMVEKSMAIDKKYPIEGLEGEELTKAQDKRKQEKITAIGGETVDAAFKKLLSPDREFFLYRKMQPEEINFKYLKEAAFPTEMREKTFDKKMCVADLLKLELFWDAFPDLSRKGRDEFALSCVNMIVRRIDRKILEIQGALSNLTDIALLKEFDKVMGGTDYWMYHEEIFFTSNNLQDFLKTFELGDLKKLMEGIDYKKKDKDEEEEKEEIVTDSLYDDNGIPIKLKKAHVADILNSINALTELDHGASTEMISAAGNKMRVDTFVKVFGEKTGLVSELEEEVEEDTNEKVVNPVDKEDDATDKKAAKKVVKKAALNTTNIKNFLEQFITDSSYEADFKKCLTDIAYNWKVAKIERRDFLENLFKDIDKRTDIVKIKDAMKNAGMMLKEDKKEEEPEKKV